MIDCEDAGGKESCSNDRSLALVGLLIWRNHGAKSHHLGSTLRTCGGRQLWFEVVPHFCKASSDMSLVTRRGKTYSCRFCILHRYLRFLFLHILNRQTVHYLRSAFLGFWKSGLQLRELLVPRRIVSNTFSWQTSILQRSDVVRVGLGIPILTMHLTRYGCQRFPNLALRYTLHG